MFSINLGIIILFFILGMAKQVSKWTMHSYSYNSSLITVTLFFPTITSINSDFFAVLLEYNDKYVSEFLTNAAGSHNACPEL